MRELVFKNIYPFHSTREANSALRKSLFRILVFMLGGLLLLAVINLGTAAINETVAYSRLKAKEQELLQHIENRTGIDTSQINPRYEFWSHKEINRAYYGDDYEDQNDVVALAKDSTIILTRGFNVDREPEVLLHELYHVVVAEMDIEYECRAAEERAAYDLQIEYVEQIGFGRKPSPLFLLFLRCDMNDF